jgi:hypothetical protein
MRGATVLHPHEGAPPERSPPIPCRMKTLLYQQTNVAIWWDSDGWLHADWAGAQSSNQIVEGSDQIFRLLQSRQVNSLLSDFTRIESIPNRAAEWIAREWFPRLRSIGVQRFAWVRSPNGVGELTSQEVLKSAPAGTVHIFWTVGEAQAWLRWEASLAMKRRSGRITLPP